MEIFYQKRCTGKTSMLIALSALNQIPIGVHDENKKRYVLKRAEEMNKEIPEPIVIKRLSDIEICGDIYVDDLDLIINKFTHIKAATMSEEFQNIGKVYHPDRNK